ncbi:hypothetical protein RN04_14775 [Arthrobacter sp. W1]|nr:hypothetical protein RN04_14775 [Arthrobacter sp. W1]
MFDVAIVGGGPAGLAAAYELEKTGLAVILLEQSARLGGRARTVDICGEPVNMGAMFVYSGTASHELALTLDVPLVPFEPRTFGIHANGATVVCEDDGQLIEQLPLPEKSKRELAAFIERTRAEYSSNTDHGQLRPHDPCLGDESAQSRLDGLPPDVMAILTSAIRGGSVAHPSELSATYALRYFASYLMREKNNRWVSTEGMQAIPSALSKSLKNTEIRLMSRVDSVTQDGNRRWSIGIGRAGQEHPRTVETIQTAHVILAVPAPRIASIAELPQWKREALEKAKTPGGSVLGVVADISAPDLAEFDDWAFVAAAGRLFDVIVNPRPGRRDGLAQFVCYGNTNGYMPEANDPSSGAIERWLEEFFAVAPKLRGRVLGAELCSWEHCFSLLTPRRNSVLHQLRAPVDGTMHFAGDYSSETAGTHGAYSEARRVSEEIIKHFAASRTS